MLISTWIRYLSDDFARQIWNRKAGESGKRLILIFPIFLFNSLTLRLQPTVRH